MVYMESDEERLLRLTMENNSRKKGKTVHVGVGTGNGLNKKKIEEQEKRMKALMALPDGIKKALVNSILRKHYERMIKSIELVPEEERTDEKKANLEIFKKKLIALNQEHEEAPYFIFHY